jgi:ribosomal protein L7/L12
MAQVKTIAAGVSFGIGLFFGLIAVLGVSQPGATRDQQFASIGVGVLGGVPAIALGSWLVAQQSDRARREERERLRRVFFNLLRDGNGTINVLRFSMESNVSGVEAKAYLDERAREFNASYNVDEEGKISYYFDGDFNQPVLSPPRVETYDVVIEASPRIRRKEAVQAVSQLIGTTPAEAKRILKQSRSNPTALIYNVDKATAERFRQRLQAAGVIVLLVLN